MMHSLKPINDPHSRQVLDVLDACITSFSQNSLLGDIRGRKLSLDAFIFLSKARLDATTNFVPFLRAIQEKAERTGGWADVSKALRDNLDEERGLTNDGYDQTKDHDTWRKRYAEGLSRTWRESRGDDAIGTYETIDVTKATERIRIEYGEKLMELAQTENLPFLTGAFAVLEGLLEQEFSAMLAYIRSEIRCLTTDESLYITHHAGHEHRHLEEVAVPLLQMCQKSPDIVPSVIRGIEAMYELREEHVLKVIAKEMAVFTAKSTNTSK